MSRPLPKARKRRPVGFQPSILDLEVRALMAPLNVLVNDPTDDLYADTQSETSLLAFKDASGRSIILSGYNDSGSTNFDPTTFQFDFHFTGYSRSTDGGATFTDMGTLPESTFGDAGDPVMARDDATGTIYYSTLSFADSSAIKVFRSYDDGLTFTQPVNAVPGRPGSALDKQWMVVDNFAGPGRGNIYMLTRDFGPGGGHILTRSTDGGETWGADGGLLVASGDFTNVQGANLIVGPDHTLYAFYFEQVPGLPETQAIKMRKSSDFGETFTEPVVVTSIASPGFFNGDLDLTNPQFFRSNAFPQVVANPASGELYLVYNDNPEGSDRADVFVRQSADGGTSWSEPIKVNDDATTHDQYNPTIAVTPDGSRVGVFFYDRRTSPTNDLIDYFGAIAPTGPNPLSFGANYRISDTSFPVVVGRDPIVNSVYMGDYDQADADNQFFYITWGDNRLKSLSPDRPGENQADIRFAKVSTRAVGPEVIGVSPDGVLNASSVASVRVTFNKPIAQNKISNGDFKVTDAEGKNVGVKSVKVVAGTGGRQFDVGFKAQDEIGLYTVAIAERIYATDGTRLDNNLNGVYESAFRVISTFTIAGPRVVASEVIYAADTSVSSLLVTFNKPMDPAKFKGSDVVVTGPGGSRVEARSATPVAGSGNTQFLVALPKRTVAGVYTVKIGPDVRDKAGNHLDQDGDLIDGEAEDAFKGDFAITAPQVVSSDPFFVFVSAPISTVTLFMNKEIDTATFTASDVTVTAPDGSAIEVTGVQPVEGTGGTVFIASFTPSSAAGIYAVNVGPDVRDRLGNRLDQDGDFVLGETPDDVFFNLFGIFAPRITGSTPRDEIVAAPIQTVRVFFSTAMDPATFDASDVLLTRPDGSVIVVTGVEPVPDTGNTAFEVTFTAQAAVGTYIVAIGPDIRDFGGNTLDQDFDFVIGETPDDVFFTTFTIAAPRLLATSVDFQIVAAPIQTVRVFFSTAMDPATFDASDVLLTRPDGSVIVVTGVEPVPDTGNTAFEVTFTAQAAANLYSLAIGPDIRDFDGNALDQDLDTDLGETPDDVYRTLFAIDSPRVAFSNPAGQTGGPVGQVEVGFSTAMDPATFDASDVILTAPDGSPITVTDVLPVDGSGNTLFTITFAEQTALGSYTLTVGPDVRDLGGNPIDQNFNFIPGEATDSYVSSFRIIRIVPYQAEATPLEAIDLAGDPGTFAIIVTADDSFASVDLGGNSFNFYDVSYTGAGQLWVSSNGLISFGMPNAFFGNDDLSSFPLEPTIAVLWDDWISGAANSDSNPMVLGKFEDVDGDGTPDRLIIQWNQVERFGLFDAGTATFLAILELNTTEPGEVTLLYPDLDINFDFADDGGSATVGVKGEGVQSGTSSNRLLISLNESSNPLVQTGGAIRISVGTGGGGTSNVPRGTAARRQYAAITNLLNGPPKVFPPPPTPAANSFLIDLVLAQANDEGTGTLSNGVVLPTRSRLRRLLGL